MQHVRVDRSSHGPVLVLGVSGELDVSAADAVVAALVEHAPTAPATDVALDLSGCTFLDSGGSRAVIGVCRELRERGHRVALVAPPSTGNVRRVLDVIGVARLLPVVDALEDLPIDER